MSQQAVGRVTGLAGLWSAIGDNVLPASGDHDLLAGCHSPVPSATSELSLLVGLMTGSRKNCEDDMTATRFKAPIVNASGIMIMVGWRIVALHDSEVAR